MSDVMREQYRELTDADKENMKGIKQCGRMFYEMCDELGQSRELSLAKTKVEEAVMWAVKHITR